MSYIMQQDCLGKLTIAVKFLIVSYLGFDFGRYMDKERMKFEFSWNMSLYNRDIWDGVMTRTQLDTALDDTLDGKIGTTYDEDGNITEGSLNFDTLDVYDPLEFEDIFIMNINMLPR